MYLKHLRREACGKSRNLRQLIGTGGDYDLRSMHASVARGESISSGWQGFKEKNFCAATYGRSYPLSIALNKLGNFSAVRESVRIVAFVWLAWKLKRPVGELKAKRVPSLVMPTRRDAGAFENQMLPADSLKVVAHREPGLAAANNNRRVSLIHRCSIRSSCIPSRKSV
jgi:hypothetical protein